MAGNYLLNKSGLLLNHDSLYVFELQLCHVSESLGELLNILCPAPHPQQGPHFGGVWVRALGAASVWCRVGSGQDERLPSRLSCILYLL